MQSGAIFHYKGREGVNKSDALIASKSLAENLNCSQNEWLECLRRADVKEMIKYTPVVQMPLEGDQVLPLLAQNAFKEHKYNQGMSKL
jgi:hypothetical protein